MNFLKALVSPFKPFKLKFYIGKTQIGVPYFLPRKWVTDPDKPGYMKAIPRKIGFDHCGLGWKTKWTETDYRFEWCPIWSFVFWRWQIAVSFVGPRGHVGINDAYWEAWLYYANDTKGTKKERIEQCKTDYPKRSTIYRQGQEAVDVNYYDVILKKKYQ